MDGCPYIALWCLEMTDENFECPPNDITGSSLDISSMMSPHWRRGLRLQPVCAPNLVGQTGAGGSAERTTAFIPDVQVLIGYERVKSCPSSHRLCPVTRWEQCGYWNTTRHSCRSFFPVTGLLSPVGYVVQSKTPSSLLGRKLENPTPPSVKKGPRAILQISCTSFMARLEMAYLRTGLQSHQAKPCTGVLCMLKP
jgi:hypothetical protein